MSAHCHGLRAWTQVAAAFLVLFCTLGLSNAFGVFQAFYEKRVLEQHAPADIAWIGTTQGALLELVGFVSGPLYDRGHVRSLVFVGALLTVGGFVAASFAAQYYYVFLSLGVCVGLGFGILYVPSLAIVSASFCARKRPLATGISAAGSSIGGVVYPIVFRTTVDSYGFGWACRIIALLNGLLLGVACALFRPVGSGRADAETGTSSPEDTQDEGLPPATTASTEPFFDATALRDARFVLFSLAMALLWLGVDVPFFYLPGLARDRGLAEPRGAYLVAGLNAASLAGRVGAGLVAGGRAVGPLGLWHGAVGASAVLLACWGTALRRLPEMAVFVALYGLATGAVMGLFAPALLVLSPDLRRVGARLGMVSLLSGAGFLVGPPIAGAVLQATGGYAAQSAFAGSAYAAGFVVIAVVVWLHRRRPNDGEKGPVVLSNSGTATPTDSKPGCVHVVTMDGR